MANQVTSHNERTMFKVLKALTENNGYTAEGAMDIVDRLLNAGILFREPAEKEEKPKNNKDNSNNE